MAANRDDVIRNDTKAFGQFRQVWSDLRAAIAALIPRAGEPYPGAMDFKLATNESAPHRPHCSGSAPKGNAPISGLPLSCPRIGSGNQPAVRRPH